VVAATSAARGQASIGGCSPLIHSGRWSVVVPFRPDAPNLPDGIMALELVEPRVSAPVVLATAAGVPVSMLARDIMQIACSGLV
jgi:hypothetical protein